jgi:Flp pilus assembly protein TadG
VSEAAISAPPTRARFSRDRRGAVAIAVAVLLPVLIGFAGIGIEVGLWFAVQRQNQSAADAAAISAALEYAAQIENGVTTNPTAAATAAGTAASYNLFSNANCSTSGTTNCTLYPCYDFTVGGSCNTSNSNRAQPNAVQVALTQPLNTAFANFVTAIWGPNINTINVTTTAIATFPMLPGGQTCLLAVGGTNMLSVTAGQTLNLPNCALASLSTSGSSIQLSGAGNPINAAAIATAGNIMVGGGSSGLPPQTFTYLPLQDPYKSVATSFSAPTPPGPCVTWNGRTPIPPGTYCGITISSGNVAFTGGTYYIIGPPGISISNSSTVSFGPGLYYLYGGGFNIIRLSGPTTVPQPTCAATTSGNIVNFSGQNCSTSGVSVGMTVTDTKNSKVIPLGTTVAAVTSTTVTISQNVVSPGVGNGDTIDFEAPSGVAGSGITIVLTALGGGSAGRIDIEGNACTATISLSGTQMGQGLLQPSLAASQGLLFFQDPTAVNSLTPAYNVIANNCTPSNVSLNGAIYTPASSDNLQGNASANFGGCTELIAQFFTFSGNLGLDDSGCSAARITLNQAQIQQVYLAM